MAQQMTGVDGAKEAAQSMAPKGDGTITHVRSSDGRHEFEYDRLVQAHRLTDGWKIVGFGKSWFAIEREN